ncbi:putative RNA-directed DNA polymerase, eukaryota, reverse transcriptase zinc-binding domain protein [Tanacetum coccineum]|uniref:RNA-directed DNA polymerase, eukaryota, reverse transcriptase zinc-binding domain protein n=1 Tax=Tanacetum coccineum TaxID=301880 RepID=A0ABQ5CL94_9ASTR
MKNLYSSIKTPSPSFKVDERMIWIKISGLPLCAWGSNAFKKVASLFGKFKFFEDEESTAMSSERVCISTRSYKQISKKIIVEVNGEMFDVHVHEIGTWSINITDNTSDTSSHMDVNGLEKDDISPREQVEEEVIKVSDTSDLSRPPGFEHVKMSSSSTSKCSANFARHQKKDIKADLLNSFIDSSSLIDLPIGGRYYTRMNKVVWISDPFLIKEAFLNYYKEKFQAHDSQVVFSSMIHSTSLTSLDRDSLGTHFSLDEIKTAIWDCGSNKALGPDGSMPQGANSSFFSLILKTSNPISIKDFHPISLIGIHYKIIAKVLASRLSKVIDKVVSKEKSAFISGRQILDGPLIIILLPNSIKRGLWQGDPLSPFLFILAMEVLHGAMSNAVNSGLIRGIKLGSSDITLSHLFYADDVVITFEWNSTDLDNIIWVLHVFHLASGLKINIHKSNIYGFGVSNDEVSSIASRTGCAAGSFPFTYLRLPIRSNMNLTSSWNILVERFQKMLSSWKANLLSIGGHLTLIKAILGSLGIYYLSIFKAPEVILKSLERLRSRLFWGGS